MPAPYSCTAGWRAKPTLIHVAHRPRNQKTQPVHEPFGSSAFVPPQTALLAMSDSDDFDLSDDEMADEGTAATVPLRPLHASRAAPPRCCCAPPTGARTGGL